MDRSECLFLFPLFLSFLLSSAWAGRAACQEGKFPQGEGGTPSEFRIPLRVFWKDGLLFSSEDGRYRLRLGGRIHWDWAFMGEDSDLRKGGFDFEDGTEFRRARLKASGRIEGNFFFKALYGFAGGEVRTQSLYAGIDGIPWIGALVGGYFKEPFGLEERTSSNYLTFLERSLPENSLVPAKNTGFLVRNSVLGKRLSWAAGVFRESEGLHRTEGESKYNVTALVGGLPWKEGGDRYFYLGLAGSLRDPGRDPKRGGAKVLRYRSRPEAHLAPWLVDTGYLDDADRARLLSLESLAVLGPFSLQAESVHTWVDSRTGRDPHFWGAYAQASFFLTGEHRPFRAGSCGVGRVHPRENFSRRGGTGAWEAAVRWSRLDLEAGAVRGGILQDWTVGLNWYLTPNVRVMWNGILARLGGTGRPKGRAFLFLARFQVDF